MAEHAAELSEAFCDGDRQLILRVDRADPSKNIVRGFEAFATLLEDHPELVGRVSFLAMLQPSRQDVPEYADYLAEIGAHQELGAFAVTLHRSTSSSRPMPSTRPRPWTAACGGPAARPRPGWSRRTTSPSG